MAKVSEKTIERYVSLWKKLESSNVRLDTLDKITFTEFKSKTNLTSKSQFNLSKSLARNPERQKQVNQYLDKKAIPKTTIKRTPEVESIPKVEKIKPKVFKPTTVKLTEVKIPKKVGQYGVIEIYDKDKKRSFWIKYDNRNDLNEQFDIIQQEYDLQNFQIIYHGLRTYGVFIDEKFKALMKRAKIEV